MTRFIPRIVHERLGKRGVVLFLFGLAWLVQGAAVFSFGSGTPPLPFWHEQLPHPTLAVIWGVTGILSMLGAFQRKRKSDTFGFLAVSATPMLLSGSYLVGAITRIALGEPTWLLGLYGFSVWGVITLALAVIAAWPEEGARRD